MGIEVFDLMKNHNQEQIAFYSDKSADLRAILAIHSTALGPAIGGIRLFKYKTIEDALFDLIRLAEAMTYKAAAGGINFGGGYMLVIDREGIAKEERFFRALGRFVHSFNGRFIAAEDIGITDESLEYMAMETHNLIFQPLTQSAVGSHSHMCAYGTTMGIKAAAKHKWGSDDISGKKIVIQGYGRVGSRLAELLVKEGADIVVTDINEDKLFQAKKDGYLTIPHEKALSEKCHILAPCAVGPVISSTTVPQFQCEIIAGASNNQLFHKDDELLLKEKGILYAHDFILNAGAIINIAEECADGFYKEKVKRKIEKIYDRLLEIIKYAEDNRITNNQSAIRYAQRRIEAVKEIKGTYNSKGKIKR